MGPKKAQDLPWFDRSGSHSPSGRVGEVLDSLPGLGHTHLSCAKFSHGTKTHRTTGYYTMKIKKVYPPISPNLALFVPDHGVRHQGPNGEQDYGTLHLTFLDISCRIWRVFASRIDGEQARIGGAFSASRSSHMGSQQHLEIIQGGKKEWPN